MPLRLPNLGLLRTGCEFKTANEARAAAGQSALVTTASATAASTAAAAQRRRCWHAASGTRLQAQPAVGGEPEGDGGAHSKLHAPSDLRLPCGGWVRQGAELRKLVGCWDACPQEEGALCGAAQGAQAAPRSPQAAMSPRGRHPIPSEPQGPPPHPPGAAPALACARLLGRHAVGGSLHGQQQHDAQRVGQVACGVGRGSAQGVGGCEAEEGSQRQAAATRNESMPARRPTPALLRKCEQHGLAAPAPHGLAALCALRGRGRRHRILGAHAFGRRERSWQWRRSCVRAGGAGRGERVASQPAALRWLQQAAQGNGVDPSACQPAPT